MSGDSSRYSHQRQRRYSQLILDQGAMVTDADQRESAAIGLRNTTTLGDTSIRTGVPKTGGVLAWQETSAPSAHKTLVGLQPGKFVADGHVGDVRLQEPADPLSDDAGLSLLHRQLDLLEAEELSDSDGPYAVFGDLWHRHVGPAEDPRLVDPGFLAARTSTRSETMAQVKLARIGSLDDATLAPLIEDEGLPRFGDFRLIHVEFHRDVMAPDECDPCATTLEDPNLDAGNELFRLEVHRSGFNVPAFETSGVSAATPDGQGIVVKWSADNGSLEVPANAVATLLSDDTYEESVFELTRVAAEQRLGLYTSDMSDRIATLHSADAIEVAAAAAPEGSFVRVWDGAVDLDLEIATLDPKPVGARTAEGRLDTSGTRRTLTLRLGGLELILEADVPADHPFILPGDAWCVEVREYATETGDKLIWEPEPVEIEHHYAYLGVLENGAIRNELQPDLRARSFPALTELDALDIGYDNARSRANAWTVQGALDLLFDQPATGGGDGGGDCQCTICIDPNEELDGQLEELAAKLENGDILSALVCFPEGEFSIRQTHSFKFGKSVVFRGAGRDVTRIYGAPGDSSGLEMLSFTKIENVRFEDMSIETVFSAKQTVDLWSASSVIRCRHVKTVDVENVSFSVLMGDDGPAVALFIGYDEHDRTAATQVTVRDSVFTLVDGTYGVVLDREVGTLSASGNRFQSVDILESGTKGAVSRMNAYLSATTAKRRTDNRAALLAEGQMLDIPGNSRMVLDLSGIPEDDRQNATQYWRVMMQAVNGLTDIASPQGFGAFKSKLRTLNRAVGLTSEAVANVDEARADARPGGRMRVSPITNALRANRDARKALFGELFGADNGPTVESASRILSMIAGEDRLDTPVDAGDRAAAAGAGSGIVALAEINAARDILNQANDFIRVAEALGAVLGATSTERKSGPITGILAMSGFEPIAADIFKNAFLDVEVGILLSAQSAEFGTNSTDVPRTCFISDNRFLRHFQTKPIKTPELTNVPPVIAGTAPAIRVRGYQELTIENNKLGQFMTSDLPIEEYAMIFDPTLSDTLPSFAAIRIESVIGPKLRAIGNSAFGFRHCLYTSAGPIWPTNRDRVALRLNFWIFRENSVLPVKAHKLQDGATLPSNWAVHFDDANTPPDDERIRFVVADNHPPNFNYDSFP